MPILSSPLKTAASSPFRGGRRQGFSLVEMLVVLAIMAILTSLAIPATTGLVQSYNLGVAAQLVGGQLSLARQTALTSNHCVQLRFYYLPDYNKSYTAAPAVFRGVQCLQEGDIPSTGNSTFAPLIPLSKVNYFPQPIVAVSDATTVGNVAQFASAPQFSTLLSQSSGPKFSASSLNGTIQTFGPLFQASSSGNGLMAPDPALPGYGYNYKYVILRFTPNGGTNLTGPGQATTANNVVSVAVENAKVVASNLPANYVTFSIDSVTGTFQVYRP